MTRNHCAERPDRLTDWYSGLWSLYLATNYSNPSNLKQNISNTKYFKCTKQNHLWFFFFLLDDNNWCWGHTFMYCWLLSNLIQSGKSLWVLIVKIDLLPSWKITSIITSIITSRITSRITSIITSRIIHQIDGYIVLFICLANCLYKLYFHHRPVTGLPLPPNFMWHQDSREVL